MWVFGYGSLVWKIDFPHVARVPGYIKGYARRFWQGSIDHRGTPEHPGRVVTLVNYDEWQQFKSLDPHSHTPDGTCWGLAIKVPDDQVEFVRAHLDHREKNGYETFTVDVYNPSLSLARNRDSSNTTTTYSENEPVVKGALLYVATSENRSFLGPVPIPRLAQHILRSEGPSGRNVDYFLGLVHAMRALVEYRDMDPHLRDLA
ncbi:ChaC-like protein, partial [Cladochytrium replicatum]